MYCPKCRNEQNNSVECEACGLIFEKFRKVQNRKKQEEASKIERVEQAATVEKSSTGLKLLQVIVLVVLVATTTYYFTGYRAQKVAEEITVPPPQDTTVNTMEPTVVKQQASKPVAPIQVSSQPVVNTQNAIQRARRSTVSIETPWGTGSGFFVNKNYIVTNRHVVEFDKNKLADFKRRMETTRQMIELEKKKINEMKRTYSKMRKGPSRSQLGIIIASREEELNRVLPQYEKGEKRLAKLDRKVRPSDIKIVLNDGSEHFANYLLVSETSDLALMSLYSGDRTYIERAPRGLGMQQGDKVYTIGSPVGLRQTVTGGIFSGYVKQGADGRVYLQTDAAINPGNSGGPLIDEHGYAHGVNTMILRNTEGIGFAIPIAKVFEEFGSALY